MSQPNHHLPAELLAEYASGAASEALAVVVATHLALCPTCRRELTLAEATGAAMLDRHPVGQPEEGLEAMMARLDEEEPTPDAPVRPQPTDGLPLPEPLRSYVGPAVQWKSVVPGVAWAMALEAESAGPPLRLARMRGGSFLPRHTHAGRELTLVLTGGYHDGDEGYERGDAAVRDAQHTHELRIDPGEDCILLVANDAPLVPVGPLAWVFDKISGGF